MPYLDFVLFRKEPRPTMTLNIGGIANLHVAFSDRSKMFGFDTGPGKVELERMKQEAANGVVTSKLDGTVLRVNDPDTAKQEGSPVVIVSGGGGYYVKTGVTELDRDKYPVGTQMRIQSWEHGEVYGTVAEISDTPVPSFVRVARSWSRASAATRMKNITASAWATPFQLLPMPFVLKMCRASISVL